MGTVTISLDAEIAWGFHDLAQPPKARIESAREGWLELIDLFEKFDIPATWAIVGHLFLKECDGAHVEHSAPEGWFDRDPGGTATDESLWFAPDLIQKLLDSDVEHEIGSHSYSHLELGADKTNKEMVISELNACNELATAWDIDLQSFVFPRNNIGHRELIAEIGYSCYRGHQPDYWYNDKIFYPLGRTVTMLTCNAPPLVYPHRDRFNLVNIPASFHLFTFDRPLGPLTRPILGDVIVSKAKSGIKVAAENEGVFHMWLHPNSLVDESDIERVRNIFDYLATTRDHTDLEVLTMGQIATEFI